jgi:hypothetical protein
MRRESKPLKDRTSMDLSQDVSLVEGEPERSLADNRSSVQPREYERALKMPKLGTFEGIFEGFITQFDLMTGLEKEKYIFILSLRKDAIHFFGTLPQFKVSNLEW